MSTLGPIAIPDPRSFPDAATAPPWAGALYRAAQTSLAAATGVRADALDQDMRATLAQMLAGDGTALAALFAGSPSVAVARHL